MDHLKEIDRILKKYATGYHFYLRDLVNHKEYEMGTRKAYPICSCFKLAVLMAFFDSLESEEQLYEEVLIKPEEFSPGVGIISYGTTAVRATWFQLAQGMMSFSDGTATDFLVNRVGIDKIAEVLKKNRPNSAVTKNLRDMVVEFQKTYPINELRQNRYKNYSFADTTDAIDLASLAQEAHAFKPKHISKSAYMACLDTKKLLGRTSLYFDQSVKSVGKTGSFGYAFFANDCGVIEFQNKVAGVFGISTQGFVVDKDIVEMVFGFVGLHLLKILNCEASPNIRYTEQTRSMLEG